MAKQAITEAGAATEEKAKQILDGAHAVFMRDGFDAASMNDIAKAAGVSKGTLYVYFDSKEALFEALIRAERKRQAERICALDAADGDVAAALTRWGEALIGIMVSPSVVAQVRTVIAVAPKFRRLGRAFYESGPQYGIAHLAAYLAAQTRAGHLEIAEPERAAVDFIQLCQSDGYKEMLFCAGDNVSDTEVTDMVAHAVDVFMRAYGAPRRNGDGR